jgi:hypothetical protein
MEFGNSITIQVQFPLYWDCIEIERLLVSCTWA